MPIETQVQLVKELISLNEQLEKLNERKTEIENFLPELVIYQDTTKEKPWVRFKKTDNIKELNEKGYVYRASITKRFTCEVENLKNMPKELKGE